MNKKLLFISMAAVLASSCSNELLEEGPSSNAGTANGITFSVVENEATRGMVRDDGSSFFFAEQDKVSIYADKVNKGGAAVNGYTTAATYKATKSAGAPWLAGVDANNILTYLPSYASNETPSFFVVYPTTDSVTYNSTSNKFTITPATTLVTQATDSTTMNFNSRILYQYIEQKPENSWNSVGESMNVQLALKSPLAMLYFMVNDIENYPDFGKLDTIKLKATGASWMDGSTEKTTYVTPLSYATGDTYVADKENNIVLDTTRTAIRPTSITLAVNAKIKNNTKANMFVIEKNRMREIEGTERVVTNKYTITYTFENIDLVHKVTSFKDWEKNQRYGMPKQEGLNIATAFPYLLTRGTTGTDRVLYVNSGTVAKIDTTINSVNGIGWADTRAIDGKVPYTEVREIVIAKDVKDLENEDWDVLRKCINATKLTINNNTVELKSLQGMTGLQEVDAPNVTKVVEGAFKNLGSNITKLNLPKVSVYEDTEHFQALDSLILTSLTFDEDQLAERFFNDNVKTTLKTCDIAAETSLAPKFGASRSILFTGYTQLETITLNASKVTICANQFKGCTNLKSVNGVLDITSAYNAFEGAGADDFAVKISGTTIPRYAFKGSKVKAVNNPAGQELAPTKIGEYAFDGDTCIVNLDLTNATEIGSNAFNGASKFKGSTNAKAGVVNLNVTTVQGNAFKGTAVERFQLLKATNVGSNALASSALKQVKFAVSVKDGNINQNFAGTTPTGVDLFVYDEESISKFNSITFKTVTISPDIWE